MLRLVGHPVAVNPDAELGRVARAEGWEVLRFERLGRRLRASAPRVSRPGSAGSARSCSRAARARARERARAAPPMSLHELTPEQREIRDLARALRRRADRARGRRRGTASTRSRASCSASSGELGLMGVCVPEEHGGAGADFLSYVLVLEELSRADAGVGVTVAVHTSACTLPLLAHGTPEQVERLVPPLAAGEELGAFALTEPGSGSDAGAMRSRAGRTAASPAPSSGSRTARTPRRSSSSRATPSTARARSSCAPARPASRSCARRRSSA